MTALQGCGLPDAWAVARQWRILETGFGCGLNFFAAWRAWKDDPARPRLLHYVAIESRPFAVSEILEAVAADAALSPLGTELARQWFGLLPGVHRLNFEGGRVMLTLHVNEVREVLRREAFVVDSVMLDERDFALTTLKAVGRHCRRGTRITLSTTRLSDTTKRDFVQCGFAVHAVENGCVHGVFAPEWAPKNPLLAEGTTPSHCVVVGAGLAGAAAASSLALRGWRVMVLDAAPQAASGASGVPAGLITPHFSIDDSLLSRLTRNGVRATLEQARLLLRDGVDWQACGVLERRKETIADDAFHPQGSPWNRAADANRLRTLGIDASTIWHEHAGWIKPAALVRAWLGREGVSCRTSMRVERIACDGADWVLYDGDGREIECAPLIVVAAALSSNAIAGTNLPLQAVRGQVSWNIASPSAQLPPFALNGNGHFIPGVPMGDASAWFAGSSFDRDDTQLDVRTADHTANFQRLQALAPPVATRLESDFAGKTVQGWTGIRCASSNRRPIIAEVRPGLWISTAMGSRGLTYSTLCAEVLAARLHAEPLPLECKLAESLRGE